MKRGRFSEEQIISILREGESGGKIGEVCGLHVISYATFYTWRKKRVAYNRERPPSSLGYVTPHEFAARAPQPLRSAADARTAWPVKRRLAGAVHSEPAAQPKPDIFSATL
jgi:putative transposase